MGVVTFTDEFTLAVPPARLFKAIVVDADNFMQKIMPQGIKTVEMSQGDGGAAGSIKHHNFAEGGAHGHTYAKERVDEIDEVNYVNKYTIIEADGHPDTVDSVAFEVKYEAGANGGCVCKMTRHYHTKGEVEIEEDEVKAGRESTELLYKAAEAYLLANPHAYV